MRSSRVPGEIAKAANYNPPMSSPYESANLILRLYELRRDPTMREARNWYARSFNPDTACITSSIVPGLKLRANHIRASRIVGSRRSSYSRMMSVALS